MIIYGWKSKQLAKETVFEKCPNCSSQSSIELYVFQKYAHVFWIPFFPIGKTAVSQCDHCNQVLKLKEMPLSLKTAYENIRSKYKTPIWMFTGLALVALLITAGVVNSQIRDERNSKFILSPQRGDIFEIKTPEDHFTLYKIQSVDSNIVFISASLYETNKRTGLDELKSKGDSAYTDDVFPVTKIALKKMLEKGEILDIDRK
ncbi:MAG: zinc-ribbon domain-containing protein [Ferruginibacter sp.]